MATSLTVLCPNGRRVTVKVTPSTAVLKVLEDACLKQRLDPFKHTLKHGGKTMDLSVLFRYTNIPKNAHLEMIPANRTQASCGVLLAVQCEDGSRHQAKFSDPLTSLWDVLERVGVVNEPSGEPVMVYMNTQVCGEEALKKKSLKDLGLTAGRAALRFLQRQASVESVTTPSPVSTVPEAMEGTEAISTPTNEAQTDPIAMEINDDVAMESDDDPPKSKLSKPSTQDYRFPVFLYPISYFPQDIPSITTQVEPPTLEPATGSMMTQSALHVEPAVLMTNHPSSLEPASVITNHPPSLEPISVNTDPAPSLEPATSSLMTIHSPSLELAASRSEAYTRDQPTTSTEPVATGTNMDAEPCDRERVVYHLDDPLPLVRTEELADDFFTITQRDVQVMQSDLKKQAAMEDAPLLTSAMRQVLKEKRFEGYSQTVLRVHLPDRWVLQGLFRPQESLKALVKFVRDNLADPGLKFHLYTTPPKTILRSGRVTLLEGGFVPAAIVYLGVDGGGDTTFPLLSRATLENAQSALQAELAIANKRGSTGRVQSSLTPSTQTSPADNEGRKSVVSAAIGKTMPKWFKIGK